MKLKDEEMTKKKGKMEARSGIKYSLPSPLPVIFGIAPIKKNKISICGGFIVYKNVCNN